jgi:hypothetical protein
MNNFLIYHGGSATKKQWINSIKPIDKFMSWFVFQTLPGIIPLPNTFIPLLGNTGSFGYAIKGVYNICQIGISVEESQNPTGENQDYRIQLCYYQQDYSYPGNLSSFGRPALLTPSDMTVCANLNMNLLSNQVNPVYHFSSNGDDSGIYFGANFKPMVFGCRVDPNYVKPINVYIKNVTIWVTLNRIHV